MAIPFEWDTGAISRRMKSRPKRTKEEMDARDREDAAGHETDLLEWLSLYDSNGHRRPETESESRSMFEMQLSFIAMSSEEQAAYIVAEKKRLGVL